MGRGSDKPPIYLGVDGEGSGRFPHKYTLLAASDVTGKHSFYIEKPEGLSTLECLGFLLGLPREIDGRKVKLFGFSLNYDWTKILTGLSDEALYLLSRSELRAQSGEDARNGPWPVEWGGYEFNLVGSKMVIRGPTRYYDQITGKTKRQRRLVIWDIFKFYQSKFVDALRNWKVGTEDLWNRMADMKENRGKFDKLLKAGELTPDDIRAYCLEECACMAGLIDALKRAADNAGIPLTVFYGAGSLAAGMLKLMSIKEKLVIPPKEMQHALACGFFGGRFENSVIGALEEPAWSYDISSAYPYQTCFLPCLEHSHWQRITKEDQLDSYGTKAALVHYELAPISEGPYYEEECTNWGPFPYRTHEGSNVFPIESGGGWVWGDEYKAGRDCFPHRVRFREAWVLCGTCNCQPFSRVPQWYLERLRIGKEGPGYILKLGLNSLYGKLAQSVGNAQFQSWVWAGLITSGTRAQILRMLGMHRNRADMLMVATDGIYSRQRLGCTQCMNPKCTHGLTTPKPMDTGTYQARNEKGELKPLGAWEEKYIPQGFFAARPGIYFPMNPTKKEIKEVRGRGVGKGIILEYWQEIIKTWEKEGIGGVAKIPNLSRFCGMKTSISRVEIKGEDGFGRGWKYRRAAGGQIVHRVKDGGGTHDAPAYGEWVERQVKLGFNPRSKREGVLEDGVRLALRRFPLTVESAPYERAQDEEGLELELSHAEALEQPEGDLVVYG